MTDDWSDLAGDAERLTGRPNAGCAVGKVLESLPEAARRHLQDALDNAGLTHSGIAAALKARGHDITANTVTRHRRSGCKCVEVYET